METPNIPRIKDLVIKAVKSGRKQKESLFEGSPFWFRYFYYLNDPLNSFNPKVAFTDEVLDLFVNREAEIKVISNYFGKAKKLQYNMHLAIIGSKGIGKHTTLKIITQIVQESFSDITIEFYNHKTSFKYIDEENLSEKQLNALDNKPLDIRIISCTGKNKWLFIKRIQDFKENTKLTISIWHTSEFPFNHNIFINRQIYFRNYEREDILEIFNRRITKLLELTDELKEYYDSLNEILIPRIAESFHGNLNICFRCFKEIHLRTKVLNTRKINLPLIDQIIKNYLIIKEQKITTKEQDIISYYLAQDNKIFITTSDLKEDLNYDRTIAWKHLENLTKKNIFQKIKYGNPSKYQINEIFLSFYEDKLKKEIIFKE